MSTSSKKRHSNSERKIAALLNQLGIPADYSAQYKLVLQTECTRLVSIGKDVFGREQKMLPDAAAGWFEMKRAAASSGIELQPVSAFRAVDQQAAIIRTKLEAGQRIDEILKVSAAPGYSEHHTGRALDVTSPGYEPLDEVFDHSSAFKWLEKTAGQFGFRLSYPLNNPNGLAYEPWHWCWCK